MAGIFAPYQRPYSLKSRLIVILLCISLIPLILVGISSYTTIDSLLGWNIETGIKANLRQIMINLENMIINLDYASKQLSFEGSVGTKLSAYLETPDIWQKYQLGNDVKGNIQLITNANPNLGVLFYYFPISGKIIFSNFNFNSKINIIKSPIFSTNQGVTIYGPHSSTFAPFKQQVFSISRKIEYYSAKEPWVYVETNGGLLEQLFSARQYALKTAHILINDQNTVVYSQVAELPPGTRLAHTPERTRERVGKYYVFGERSRQGWRIAAVINQGVYNRAIMDWVRRFLLIGLLSLASTALLGLAIWRIVYRPLRYLNRQMKSIPEGRAGAGLKKVNIIEFDALLAEFDYMRQRIAQLISEVERKEKLKKNIEIENLMHQINPHFLHNTLNTIQWMARLNGQDEIDRLVALMTRVLHYNLGKEGTIVTVGQEVEALRDYLDLQRMRADNRFQVEMEIPAEVMAYRIPRFILQPLVENAIYHGLKGEEGCITVSAGLADGFLHFAVADDGAGMSAAEIGRLLGEDGEESRRSTGLGIGLNYVNRVLRMHYGGETEVEVRSAPNAGTSFILRIPAAVRAEAAAGRDPAEM